MHIQMVALAIRTGNYFRVRKAILKNSRIFSGAIRTLNVSVRTGTFWTILIDFQTIYLHNFLIAFQRR
jgi:hypothetical protein